LSPNAAIVLFSDGCTAIEQIRDFATLPQLETPIWLMLLLYLNSKTKPQLKRKKQIDI